MVRWSEVSQGQVVGGESGSGSEVSQGQVVEDESGSGGRR